MAKDYKETLNLPKTDFQMKAELSVKEPQALKAWEESGLYAAILKAGEGRERYILHDGPPYANGHIHMGHALNKILKDIVVKSRFMAGFATDYVPGWDCHGLPIELQVEKELGKDKATATKVEVREKCRKYAEKFVEIQREEFKRLGVFGKWDEPYLTMNYGYQAAILSELARFVDAGAVYRGKKPVHWCSSCATALAEAEVEYADKTSPSVYVRFDADRAQFNLLFPGLTSARTVSVIIWTTTPWTLPANLAVALNPEVKYSVFEAEGCAYIAASALVDSLKAKTGWKEVKVLREVTFPELKGLKLRHPFIERNSVLLPGDHVTLDAGTGCVHIAPGHGHDDYELGLKYGLDIYTPVDDRGKFTSDVPEFAGEQVFKANKMIIKLLDEKGKLLKSEDVLHSYPHCWRCKGPIIFRATEQWFVSMEKTGLRERALRAIKEEVEWVPSWGMERIYNMIANRPDWCLSRQRAWGVPIPALKCSACGKAFLDRSVIDKLSAAVEEKGADVWFSGDVREFMPEGIKCPDCGKAEFTRGEDILDVWFDSGVSFSAVLEKNPKLGLPAALYLEGSDQHRGWFHSSLLASLATRNAPPYKRVLTHGFVVDGEGRKMSKSTGNVMAPSEVINKYGAEVLRLWASSEDYRDDIRISEEIIKRLSEAYRRIRNTFRYILGNLYDFDPEKDTVAYGSLSELDRYALMRLALLVEQVRKAYETFQFHAIFHAVHNFCTVDMSNFYLDALKDRLYTSRADSTERRAAQTAVYTILDHLTRLVAPVLVFTSDEAWGFMPGREFKSVHLAPMPEPRPAWIDRELEEKWKTLIAVKNEASRALELARKEKAIGHPLDAKVALLAPDDLKGLLKAEAEALREILIVSELQVDPKLEETECAAVFYAAGEIPGLKIVVCKAGGGKCERCWHYSIGVGSDQSMPELCPRCVKALS